jgi:dGTPase
VAAAIAVPTGADSAEETPLASRAHPEQPHPYRTPFVRDIGRILHAKAFRRLAGKTQVFTRRAEESDHSRSRLTHTLEVAQIARTIAATLGLNAPLAEALALVHDIGHPPFGHAGEKALDTALQAHGLSFDHNLHALRIVTRFEERYAGFRGLNLTLGVREGIIKHSRDYAPDRHPELNEYFLDQRPPLEAQLIDLADEIAYLTADLEDGILSPSAVAAQVPLFADFYQEARQRFPAAEPRLLTNEALKQILNAMVTDLMQQIAREIEAESIATLADLRKITHRIARLSPALEEQRSEAKRFLYANLYQSSALDAELLPPDHQHHVVTEGAPRAVADYIAGMTDAYIEQAWHKRN